VIFRFSKREHLIPMLQKGTVRFAAASTYADPSLGGARADDEVRKARFYPARHTKLRLADGSEVMPSADLVEHATARNYYVLSMACDYRPLFFSEFRDSDACFVIHDVDAFAERLETIVSRDLPEWLFHHNPVEYFDPHERASPQDAFFAELCKDFTYAYQMEYRFICYPPPRQAAVGDRFFNIGSLRDIAKLFIASPRTTSAT
jgi:hypothetical protein